MRNIPHKALVAFLGLFPFSLSAYAQTLTEWKTLLGEPDIRSISFSHDGKLLAAGASGTLVIWSVESGKEVRRLSGHTQAVHCVSFSPDGKLLASAGEDQTIKIWSSETWQELRSLPHSGTMRHVSFSPDGKLLASGGTGRTIKLQLDETEKDRGPEELC